MYRCFVFVVKLSLQSLLNNKKRTLTLSAIISLLILAIVSVNLFNVSSILSEQHRRKLDGGGWHYAMYDGEFDDTRYLLKVGSMYQLESPYNIGSFDEDMLELSYFNFVKGRAPKNSSEIILTLEAVQNLSLDFDVNQSVQLEIDGTMLDFTVVGIIREYENAWMVGSNIDFIFPSIITTGYISSEISQFALTDNKYLSNENYVANVLVFPQLSDPSSETYRYWWIQDQAALQTRTFLSNALVLLGLFAMFTLFRFTSSFYEQKVLLLRHLGISKVEAALYLFIHTIYYVVLSIIVFYLSSTLLVYLFSLNTAMRYGIDYNLLVSSMRLFVRGIALLHLILNSKVIVMRLVANTKIFTYKSIMLGRVLQWTMILMFYVGGFSMMLPSLLEISDTLYPMYSNLVKSHSDSYSYGLWAGSDISYDKDNVLESNRYIPKSIWTQFSNHEDVIEFQSDLAPTFIYRFESYPYNEHALNTIGIRYVDEQAINELVASGVNISPDFIYGKSLIIIENIEDVDAYNNIHIGSNIIINEKQVYSLDDYRVIEGEDELSKYEGILASEAFFESYNIDIDLRTSFTLKLDAKADANAFDSFFSRNNGGMNIVNRHMDHDISMADTKGQLIFSLTQLGLFLVVSMVLLISAYINELVIRKQEIGLKKLIGFSNTEIMVQSTRKYLIVGLLSIGPAMAFGVWQYVSKLYTSYLLYLDAGDPIIPFNTYFSEFVSKSWDLFIGSGLFLLVFIVIIMVVIVISSWVLIARNPFELIDEKE